MCSRRACARDRQKSCSLSLLLCVQPTVPLPRLQDAVTFLLTCLQAPPPPRAATSPLYAELAAVDPQLADLVLGLLAFEPGQRLTAHQASASFFHPHIACQPQLALCVGGAGHPCMGATFSHARF